MELIDYTGKLNKHDDYIKILYKLKEKCKYIDIVIINGGKTNEIIEKFKDNIIETRLVSEWKGTTILESKNKLYRLLATEEIFKYLTKYETFCKYLKDENFEVITEISDEEFEKNFLIDCSIQEDEEEFEIEEKYGDEVIITDFGYDDIAFYNEKNEVLLFTTTHEGYITVSEQLIVNNNV